MTSSAPATASVRSGGSGLQAVLLDMDGTLVDTEDFWWDAEVETFAALGHTLDEAWRTVVVGGPMARSAGFLLRQTRAEVTLDELTVLLNAAFLRRLEAGVPLMPGARRLLGELRAARVPTALVTASHRTIMDRLLDSLGAENFAYTLAGDELRRTKPHPDPYLSAAARLGADPARCVVVEDTMTGVAAAEAAGCPVVAVPSLSPIAPRRGRAVRASLADVDLAFLRSRVATGAAAPR